MAMARQGRCLSDENAKRILQRFPGFSSPHGSSKLGAEVAALLKENIREYAMYIALVVIFITFTIATQGLFVSSTQPG